MTRRAPIALATGYLILASAATQAAGGDRTLDSGATPTLRLRTAAPAGTAVGSIAPHLLLVRPGEVAATADRLAAGGVRVLRYLPDGALLVVGPTAVTHGVAGVKSAAPWTPNQAIVPELAAMTSEIAARFTDGVPVVVGLVPGADVAAAAERLASSGASVSWTDPGAELPEIGLRIEAGSIPRVLQTMTEISGLVWADVQPPVRLRNSASAWLCQSGVSGFTPVFGHGVNGDGQVVGVMDTGLDADMCSFFDSERGLPPTNDDHGTSVDTDQRKVLAVDFWWTEDWPDPGSRQWDSNGHGTHVAGSVAGDDGANGVHDGDDGMAPGARLVIQDSGYAVDDCADLPGLGCPTRSLEPMLAQAWAQGAHLHTNSWGDEENFTPHNRYTERTADVDRFCWEHKDMLVFFAAGNAGRLGDDTVGSPATGKNVVAVGATWHGDLDPICVVEFSSRGWTHDGRIKPDVVVPGHQVVSAANDFDVLTGNCDTRPLSGTSMASPTAAGLAALVRQYYEDGYYPDGAPDPVSSLVPSAALVKATLIASAVDLSELGCALAEPVPSRGQGWGLVQLDSALHFAGDARRLLVDDHRTGFESSDDPPVLLTFTLDHTGPLKVALVWTDPPSSSAAAVNLVNDLDLAVAGPDGVFLGNAMASGASVAGGEADRLNNVEVVRLPAAEAGTWTVTVAPHAVNLGPQDYALVVTGEVTAHAPRRPRGRVGGEG